MEALEYVDVGVIGEGEITVCELADSLEGKRDLNSVNGIICVLLIARFVFTLPVANIVGAV